MKSVAVIGTG